MGKRISTILFFIIFICLLAIAIQFIVSSGGIDTSVFKNPNFKIALIISIFLIILVAYMYIYSSKKKEKEIENILNTVVPHKGVLDDILIFKYFVWDRGSYEARFYIYPIILDLENKKKYLSVNFHCLGTYYYSYSATIFTKFKYELTKKNGEKINIGDYCKIYIKQENGNCILENNYIKIYNKNCNYKGKLDGNNIVFTSGGNLLFSVLKDNILDEINDIALFDGIVDFDINM